MAHKQLWSVVQRMAVLTQGLPDTALDLPWRWREYDEGVRFALLRTVEQLQQYAARSEARRLLRLVYQALANVENALLGGPEPSAAEMEQLAREIEARVDEIAGVLIQNP